MLNLLAVLSVLETRASAFTLLLALLHKSEICSLKHSLLSRYVPSNFTVVLDSIVISFTFILPDKLYIVYIISAVVLFVHCSPSNKTNFQIFFLMHAGRFRFKKLLMAYTKSQYKGIGIL